MLDLTYYMPVDIIYGENCVSENAARFSVYGKKCMLVTGKDSAKRSGALDDVISVLEENNVEYKIFDEVSQNPKVTACRNAGALARGWGADFVVGIGGGSPLDAAKAVSVFAANDIGTAEVFEGAYENAPLPLLLVGTTAGTGSEVTPYSVLIADDTTGQKQTIRGVFARHAFCDWRYTRSLPYDFSVATALDALTHCAEGYFCSCADSISDGFAIEGIRLVCDVLTSFEPDKGFSDKQRQKLFAASVYGGLTITKTGSSFCHGMGYFLTEQYGVAHGVACAVFLPEYLKRGFEFETKKADKLTYEIDVTLSQLCNLVENFTDYTPVALDVSQRNDLYERWSSWTKFQTAPGNFTADDAMAVLDKIFPVQ